MLTGIFDWIRSVLASILPLSPFQQYIDRFRGIEFLGWLNWFVPISDILSVFAVYLTCVAAFYLYSIVLRWVKVLGD